MKVAVAGSVGGDHIMSFGGKFTDSLVAGSLAKVSLSFLVDTLEIRRGGCGANIAFGMGALGLNPILIAAVGKDWVDYQVWLDRHGVDTSHVLVSEKLHTAMMGYSQMARELNIPVAADPSQQMARMDGKEIAQLIDGAKYLFLNEYELALAIQKTGWTDRQLFDRVQVRVVTLGSKGAQIEEHGKETIYVGVPKEKAKLDPTGVGDNFRSGFIAGLSWGLNHERCGQLGSMLATYCIETTGTQEYKFTKDEFLTRFETAYGKAATAEIKPHLNVKLVG